MNDLFYEIIMQSSVLITGLASDKAMLLYNLFLSIFGLFELPELYVLDLAGQSSKYSRFSPAVYAPSEILETLNSIHGKMCARIDGNDTAKPIFLYIHNFDSIISQFYGKEKKEAVRLISDMVNRGECANLHIAITADKCTNSLFSDFSCKIYSGKADRKTAQKYFGAVASSLTNFDCSASGQALTNISGTIYKFNVPELPESYIDSIMQDLTGIVGNAPVCPEIAPTVRPAQIRIKSRAKTAKPTETALQPDIQQSAQQSDDTDKNIIVLLLSAIITLLSCVFNRISAVRTRSLLAKIPVTVAMVVLYILSMPIKFLNAVATSAGSTGFSGGFTVLCMVYLISCTAAGMMG